MNKICIRCNNTKDLSMFYKHKQMTDGHFSKCIECCKEQEKLRQAKLQNDPEWVEKEKTRGRDKYHKYKYKNTNDRTDIVKRYRQKYLEKILAKNASQYLIKNVGFELHHWSYNKEHYIDVIELSIKNHKLLHRHMIYDQDLFMYRDSKGVLLDSKQSHVDLLNRLIAKL